MNQAVSQNSDRESRALAWLPSDRDTILAARYAAGNRAIDWHVKRSGCYRSWHAMMSRTKATVSKKLTKLYAEKGISVCPEWHDFWQFYADMGGKPLGSNLQRIHDDKDFTKDNCYWSKPMTRNGEIRRQTYFILNGIKHKLDYVANALAIDKHHLRKMFNERKATSEITLSSMVCLTALQTERMTVNKNTKTINQWAEVLGIHASVIRSMLYSGKIPDEIVAQHKD